MSISDKPVLNIVQWLVEQRIVTHRNLSTIYAGTFTRAAVDDGKSNKKTQQ